MKQQNKGPGDLLHSRQPGEGKPHSYLYQKTKREGPVRRTCWGLRPGEGVHVSSHASDLGKKRARSLYGALHTQTGGENGNKGRISRRTGGGKERGIEVSRPMCHRAVFVSLIEGEEGGVVLVAY